MGNKFKSLLYISVLIVFVGCSSGYESILLFKNLDYSGERILPIKSNNSELCFRVWFNNSTSIDRIITISKDSLLGYQGKLTEIGYTNKKKKKSTFFNEEDIEPKCGFEKFFQKLDSLNIEKGISQKDFEFVLHEPFSIYIVEYKNEKSYNQFDFKTHYPLSENGNNIYLSIEKLIFDEFSWGFYLKKEKQ